MKRHNKVLGRVLAVINGVRRYKRVLEAIKDANKVLGRELTAIKGIKSYR